MKSKIFSLVFVFLIFTLIVYAAQKQVGPSYLNIPSASLSLEVYSSFNITCSYDQVGNGGNANANVLFEFNSSSFKFTNISLNTIFSTSDSNPKTNVLALVNVSINVSVNDIGEYNIRCFVVDLNNNGVTSTTINRLVNVSDTLRPSFTSYFPLNGTSFISNGSINITVSATVVDNFRVDSVILNVTNPLGLKFSLFMSNNTVSGSHNISFVNKTHGRYNITIIANDTSGNLNISNGFFYVNDTLYPLIDFGALTENNNSNFSRDFVFVNVTVVDENPANITFTLYNSSSLVNMTVYHLGDLSSNLSVNFTFLAYGYYFYNVSLVDIANNKNQTVTLGINLTNSTIVSPFDTTLPQVTIISPQNTSYSNTYMNFNFSINEDGVCVYSLDGGITNYSMVANLSNTGFSAANASIADGSYTLRAYCNDTAGNLNGSLSVTFSKDSTPPTLYFGAGVEANNSNFSRDFIFVNVTISEAHPANITFSLYNTSSQVNLTIYSLGDLTSNLSVNFTSLLPGYYFYNVSITDGFNNKNHTQTRGINLTNISSSTSSGGGNSGGNLGGGGGGGAEVIEDNAQNISGTQQVVSDVIEEQITQEENTIDLEPIHPYMQEIFTRGREDILEMRRQGIGTSRVETLFEEAYNAFLALDYINAELKLLYISDIKQKAFEAKQAIEKIKRNPTNFLTGAATSAFENEDFEYVIKAASVSTNGPLIVYASNLIIVLVLVTFVSRFVISRYQNPSLYTMLGKKRRLKSQMNLIRKKTNTEIKKLRYALGLLDKKIKNQARIDLRRVDAHRKKLSGKISNYTRQEKKTIRKVDFIFKRKEQPNLEEIRELNKKRIRLRRLIRK